MTRQGCQGMNRGRQADMESRCQDNLGPFYILLHENRFDREG
jgi:hypothetical protein